MTISKNEALAILNISSVNEAEEAYEELLFKWKQKYLSTVPTLGLINSHIKKIERLNEAASHFIPIRSVDGQMKLDSIDFQLSLVDYFRMYQTLLMKLKLEIASSADGYILIQYLKELIYLENNMLDKLVYYSPDTKDSDLIEVKISAPNDYYLAQKELIEKEISETEIINYLSRELKWGTFPYNSSLLNEVLKAIKIKQ